MKTEVWRIGTLAHPPSNRLVQETASEGAGKTTKGST